MFLEPCYIAMIWNSIIATYVYIEIPNDNSIYTESENEHSHQSNQTGKRIWLGLNRVTADTVTK